MLKVKKKNQRFVNSKIADSAVSLWKPGAGSSEAGYRQPSIKS